MAKHTPGPWRLTQCSNGGKILVRGGFAAQHIQSHLQILPDADAELIADAPALLDVVEELVRDDGAKELARAHAVDLLRKHGRLP